MALNLIKKDESRSVVSIKLDEQEFHPAHIVDNATDIAVIAAL